MYLISRSFLTRAFALSLAAVFCSCGSAGDDNSFGPANSAQQNDSATGSSAATANEQTETATVAQPTPTSTPASATASNISPFSISKFVWKPKSERNGNLVVLVNPTNVRIMVTGSISETLSNSGPSNGFGTTGRSNFSGCSFGSDATVEFFDSRGRRIRTAGGRSSLNIPRGCDRFEFG